MALLWTALAISGLPARAGTFYVSNEGSDSGAGTQDDPWKTVQKAVNSVAAGDTIRIGAGTYGEDVVWVDAAAGTASSPITLDGLGMATVHRIEISKPHWIIQNLTIRGYDLEFRAHVMLKDHAHHTRFLNNVVDNSGAMFQPGIELSQAGEGPFNPNWPSHCVFRNNTITGVKGRAALIMSGSNNLFENNIVKDLISADMVRLFGENNIIRDNRFSNNVPEEGIGYHPDFIQTFGVTGIGSRGHIIERNLITDSVSQIGQLVEGTADKSMLIGTGAIGNWTFRNNVFANFSLGTSLTIPDSKWYNNVFYKCNYDGGHAINPGFGDRGSSEGIRVLNNVFLDCGLLDRDNSGWYGINENYQDYLYDHNFVAKNGYRPVKQENPPNSFRWYEPHGINGGDPRFVNPAAYDFRLREGSPLIGRGMEILGFSDDFAGNPRPKGQGWDIGAFQFVGVPAEPTPPANLQRIE